VNIREGLRIRRSPREMFTEPTRKAELYSYFIIVPPSLPFSLSLSLSLSLSFSFFLLSSLFLSPREISWALSYTRNFSVIFLFHGESREI